MQKSVDLKLPKREADVLKKFCAEVENCAGSELLALLLFGDAARGDFYPSDSDLSLAVILRNTSIEALRLFREPLRNAQAATRLVPMFLSQDDLDSATDVFPTKFLLMKHQHQLLFGEDLLNEVSVEETHLRLRCEQELRNLTIRQRASFVRAARPERVEQLVKSGVTGLLNNLRVMCYLKTKALPATDQETVKLSAQEFSFPSALLEKGLKLKKKELQPEPDEIAQLFEEMMELTRKLVKLIDKMEV